MPLSSVKLKEDDRVNVEPTTVAGISAFLGKLWKMVEDPKTDHLISWGKSGNTFVIKNQIDFAKTILPNYYKHNNIASFIRQLNMYGFHKIISTTSGALDSNDNDEIEFTHPCFVRGHPYLLEQIKRKMNNPKENFAKSENGNQFNESIKRVLNDIKNLKGKQEHLGSQLSSVKQENEILWRELSLLRQKHAAQQNVLNKLIRFLVSLAQPSNHGLVKRRLVPLMLKDASSSSRTKQEPIIQEGDHVYTLKKRDEPLSPGPTIHEIHPSEMLDNVQIIETPVMEVSAESPVMLENEIITSPSSSISNSDGGLPSPEPVPAALLLPTTNTRKSKNRMQTLYVSNNQSVPTHFLISQPSVPQRHSPEYLIPDNTDNPLMELVHETVADDDSGFITVVANEDGDLVTTSSPEQVVIDKTKRRSARKNAKRNTQLQLVKTAASKQKVENKRKPPPPPKEKSNETVTSNDFLVDIGLANFNEPLVEIHTPSPNPSTQPIDSIKEEVLKAVTNPDKPVEENLTLDMNEIINIPSAAVTNLNDINLVTNEANIANNSLISPKETIAEASDDVIFNLSESNADADAFLNNAKPTEEDKSIKSDDDVLMKRINECIDNAQNMKIACTDNSLPPSRAYVDDISMQLDTMQSDLNQLKELIQNEGLTLDVNTLMGLFNEDPLDYNMPSDSSTSFPKPGEKISGNELISAPSMFDFNDIFSQGDWTQPNTPLSTMENDYYNLNTPQIDSRTSEESQSVYAPPSKKIKS